MALLLQKLLQAGASIETLLSRVSDSLARLFFSKARLARRTHGRLLLLKRRQFEAERLDRLRHPSNYQGR